MNVECTHCNTVFRVDPRKVPPEGARVRCSICRGVFEIAAPEGAVAPSSAPAPEPESAPPPVPAPPPPAVPPPAPAPAPVSPRESEPRPAPAPAPAPPPATAASPFGAHDPGAKARRLARALVSDIVTYHPERRDRALADGTLKREFMEEIKKSWEEFVAQVGPETARGSTHFRDALNDVLAKGQPVF